MPAYVSASEILALEMAVLIHNILFIFFSISSTSLLFAFCSLSLLLILPDFPQHHALSCFTGDLGAGGGGDDGGELAGCASADTAGHHEQVTVPGGLPGAALPAVHG